MSSILSIRNVSKQYANHLALDNLNLEVPENSIFGLLGPNGAGKTSLIRIITQITGCDTGEVYYKNELLNQKHIGRIGYLPEERGLYKKMEVAEQLIYMGQLKGLSKRDAISRCKYWMEKFEIQTWEHKKLEELSKGMQQKVQFITTVLHEPELIILDEPFTGFDPINANIIKDEIIELNKKGATIIFSTHRMESVEELCDHLAMIHKSKKVLEGTTRDIKNSFRKDEYEIEYRDGNINIPEVTVISEEKIHDELKLAVIKCSELPASELIKRLSSQIQIEMFKHRIPSINDIFIDVVERN